MASNEAKSLPLILARELSANLATPMFLLDARGMLVFYNDAAALLMGRPFTEMGEIAASDFGADLRALRAAEQLEDERRPAHQTVLATMYNGNRLLLEATAYPLFGANGEMHGVISVFWEPTPEEHTT